MCVLALLLCFFFKYSATTEIYTDLHTLSLHDALPIYRAQGSVAETAQGEWPQTGGTRCRRRGVARHRALLHARIRRAQSRARDFQDLPQGGQGVDSWPDRKSTRLNSSH